MRTIDQIFEESGLTVARLAEEARLTEKRVAAIVDGRWTPSPHERQRLAAALGVNPSDVSWGHTLNRRNLRYRQHGHPESYSE